MAAAPGGGTAEAGCGTSIPADRKRYYLNEEVRYENNHVIVYCKCYSTVIA
jgi:hypothetical protein